jgi:hypothetical protein
MERAASQFREGEFISAEIVANLPTRARRDGDRSLFEWSSGR